MIFSAKNRDGVPMWQLVKEGKKTVTRRLKPLWVDDEFAIQPARCMKAIGRAKVLSCIAHHKWLAMHTTFSATEDEVRCILSKEANKEGFDSWDELMNWFKNKKINTFFLYRIEFELL